MNSQLCSEVNGGGCKNKVLARNGFACSAGHSKGAARSAISKTERPAREDLAKSTEDEALQLELFRTGDNAVRFGLAENPSIGEAIQLELFRTEDVDVQSELALNPSIGKDIAIELAKVDQIPYGYINNKSLAELIHPENLDLLNQYPIAFSQAYLDRLLANSQEDKEESKALTLHSYLVYEKSGGEHTRHYKGKILKRYAGDQEIALILSTEPA